MRVLVFLLFLGSFVLGRGQDIYVLDESNNVFSLDMASCSVRHLYHVDRLEVLSDLAVDTAGNVYGINELGDLFQLHLDGSTTLIHSFLLLQSFHALWCDAQGMIYASGSEGFLYTYDLHTDRDKFLGDVGYIIDGDLINSQNQLYASAGEGGMVKVDQENPSASSVIIESEETRRLKGLFNFDIVADDCSPAETFGITDQGQIVSIDFINVEATVICQLDLSVMGTAGTSDFLNTSPLNIDKLSTMASQCSANTGRLLLQLSGGTGGKSLFVDGEPEFADSIISGLDPGQHLLEVWDETNCHLDTSFVIMLTDTPKISDVVISLPNCDIGQGAIVVEAVGANPFFFQLDDAPVQDTNYFSGLVPDDYLLQVFDSNGCFSQRMVTIGKSSGFDIKEIIVTPAKCQDPNGSVLVKMEEEFGAFTYRLAGNTSSEPIFQGLNPGSWPLEITDNLGCKIDTFLEVGQARCGIFVPEAFSPNNDGINELFKLYTDAKMEFWIDSYQIFNRWGGLIFASSDFSSHSEVGWWNGRNEGRPAPLGSYIYQISITSDNAHTEQLQGIINLIR